MRESTSTNPTPGEHFYKYITKNSEYLVTGDRCLDVRALGSLTSNVMHDAVQQRLFASVRWGRDGSPQVLKGQQPKVGDSLLFGESGKELLTSVVRRIETLSTDVEVSDRELSVEGHLRRG
jgi:hypothetical protein